MDNGRRLLVYERKEILVLIALGVMVAIFAFTLGVHLGKKVGPRVVQNDSVETTSVGTTSDKVPTRQEIQDESKQQADGVVEDAMSQALHDEVQKTGLKMDQAKQVDLPSVTRSDHAGETTHETKKSENETAPKKHETVKPKHVAEVHPAIVGEPKQEKSEVLEDEVEKPLVHSKTMAHSKKYSLQVGSFKTIEEAQEKMAELAKHGLEPVMKSVNLQGKGSWHRVLLGDYATRTEADHAGSDYKSKKMIASFVVTIVKE